MTKTTTTADKPAVLCLLFGTILLAFAGGSQVLAQDKPDTHADIVRSLDEETLERGEEIYNVQCYSCHARDGSGTMPSARAFNSDTLKYGSDLYSMWRTITQGTGMMGAQSALSDEEAYAAAQYIRQQFIRPNNPSEYEEVTDEYLDKLAGIPIEREEESVIVRKFKQGMQSVGQEYAQSNLGNYGNAIYSQIKDHANSALTVELSDSTYLSYDVHRMGIGAVWQGSIDFSETKYQMYRGEGEPAIDGEPLRGLDRMRWNYHGNYHSLGNLVSDRTPFSEEWLEYHGHYKDDEVVVLSYSIMGREVLEMPSSNLVNEKPVVQHTFRVASGDSWRRIDLGGIGGWDSEMAKEGVFLLDSLDAEEGLPGEDWGNVETSLLTAALDDGGALGQFVAAGVNGETEGLRWDIGERHQIILFIPASDEARTFRVQRFSGSGMGELKAFASHLEDTKNASLPDFSTLTDGGERTWDETVVVEGGRNVGRPHYDPIHYGEENPAATENLVSIPEHYPYTVDRIGLPFDNPWDSWFRPMGFDFFEDGRLVVATYVGDVWIAEGVDDDLDEIRWQRIATGLYDPYGLKVVDGEIYVAGRDRIYRLNDLNGDGETDFFESFFADTDVSSVPVQAFNFSLEVDSRGNFYYAKAGQYTNNDDPGNVIRVTPDGERQESIATGFRAPNGVTVGPNDRIFVSDNQGNWSPANKISIVEEGGFYGYIPSIKTEDWAPGPKEYEMRPDQVTYPEDHKVMPDTFRQPIMWSPQEFDNSPGNGQFTPKEWGPLGGRLLWTSYGKGWVYDVMMQEVDGVTQAAGSALPFQFDSGIQRARVGPDGQYYVAGVTGWDDGFATKYGSIDRIRYTGGEGFFVNDVNAQAEGIEITFNQPLDLEGATQPDQYDIKQWNYRWKERYGSAHWSVENPDEEGEDGVPVQEVVLSNDGTTALLKLSDDDYHPVDQMRIRFDLASENGKSIEKTIYMTIHEIPAAGWGWDIMNWFTE